MKYRYLDSGEGKRLEKWGEYILVRPCAHAIWPKNKDCSEWNKIDASFSREKEEKWHFFKKLPKKWEIDLEGVRLLVAPTGFGHVGVFPEHSFFFKKLPNFSLQGKKVLHLFAYTGAMTMALAKRGAKVTHIDASKPSLEWAKENEKVNQVEEIRYILEDVQKFVKREVKRGVKYDAIILDPPSFGRGVKKEVFKIENDLLPLLMDLKKLLVEEPLFVLLTCHSPSFTPIVLGQVMKAVFSFPSVEKEEIVLSSSYSTLPLGGYALGSFL